MGIRRTFIAFSILVLSSVYYVLWLRVEEKTFDFEPQIVLPPESNNDTVTESPVSSNISSTFYFSIFDSSLSFDKQPKSSLVNKPLTNFQKAIQFHQEQVWKKTTHFSNSSLILLSNGKKDLYFIRRQNPQKAWINILISDCIWGQKEREECLIHFALSQQCNFHHFLSSCFLSNSCSNNKQQPTFLLSNNLDPQVQLITHFYAQAVWHSMQRDVFRKHHMFQVIGLKIDQISSLLMEILPFPTLTVKQLQLVLNLVFPNPSFPLSNQITPLDLHVKLCEPPQSFLLRRFVLPSGNCEGMAYRFGSAFPCEAFQFNDGKFVMNMETTSCGFSEVIPLETRKRFEFLSSPFPSRLCSKVNLHWNEAKLFCESAGARLCTKQEISLGIASNTGCNFDFYRVWTSTRCSHSPPSYWTLRGGGGGDKRKDFPPLCLPAQQKGFPGSLVARCCADNFPPTCVVDNDVKVYQPANQSEFTHMCPLLLRQSSLSKLSCAELLFSYSKPTPRNAIGDRVCTTSTLCGNRMGNFFEAFNFCSSLGARLCLAEEIVWSDKNEPKCNVWTSEEVSKLNNNLVDRTTIELQKHFLCCGDEQGKYCDLFIK